MAEVSLTVEDRAVLSRLQELVERTGNPDPALRAIGNAWLTNVQLGFRSGTDPYGRPWKQPLRGGQPLRDTGRLAGSFDYTAGDGELALGTNVRYAAPHQEGATIRAKSAPYLLFKVGSQFVRKKQVKLPQRKMLPDAEEGLPDDWREDALDALDRYLGASDGR